MQGGRPVIRLRPDAGREAQVKHEPDRLGVAVAGGVGQGAVISGGELLGQVGGARAAVAALAGKESTQPAAVPLADQN